MQNYQTAIDATSTAMNSQGSATRENEQYLLSLEARLNKMKNAWTEMAITMGDALLSDGIVEFSEMISNLTKSMSNLMKHIGFLPPVIGTVSFAFMVLNNGIRTTIANAGLATVSATTLQARLLALGASAKLVGTAFLTAGRFMVGAFPPLLLITGITYGLEKLLSAWMKGREEARQYEEALNKQIDAYSKNSVKIKEQAEEYIQLKSKVGLTASEKEKLISISNELSDVLPNLSKNIDNTALSFEKEAEIIRNNLELLEKYNNFKIESDIASFDSNITNIDDDIANLEFKKKFLDNIVMNLLGADKKLAELLGMSTEKSYKYMDKVYNNIIAYDDKINEKQAERSSLIADQAYNTSKLNENTQSLIDSDKLLIQQFANNKVSNFTETSFGNVLPDEMDDAIEKTTEFTVRLNELREELGKDFDLNILIDSGVDITKLTDEQTNALKKVNAQVSKGSVEWEQHKNSLEQANFTTIESTAIVDQLNDSYRRTQGLLDMGLFTDPDGLFPVKTHEEYNQIVEEGTQLYVKYNGAIIELSDSIDGLTDSYSKLQDAEKEVNLLSKASKELIDINVLSIDTVSELSKKYGSEFTDALAKGTEATRKFLEKRKDKTIEVIREERAETLRVLEETKTRIEAINKEINAINDRELAYANAMPTRDNYFYDRRKEELEAESKSLESIAELEAKIAEYNNAEKYLTHTWNNSTSKETKKVDPYVIDTYQQSISNLDIALKILESDMSKYIDTSQEYQEYLSSQIHYLTKKEDLIKTEIENTRTLISTLKEQEAMSKNLKVEDRNQLLKDIESAESKLNSLVTNKWDVTLSLDAKLHEQGLGEFNALNVFIEEYDQNLSMVQATRDNLEEGSAEWNQSLLEENQIYSDKRQILNHQVTALEGLLSTLTRGTTVYKEVNDLLNKTKLAYLQVGNSIESANEAIKQQREKLADDMIALLKKAIEKERELLVKAKEKELDELEKAHKKKIDFLDEELDKYQELYDAKMKSIERAEDERDFTKELNKANQEKQKIQDQLNILMLDDSLQAQSQRVELEEQLAQKTEEIEEMQHKRSIDLRKQNLSDQMDGYKKDIEGKKKAETDKYNAVKERLETEKQELEYHYQELLNNEIYFNEQRNSIIKNGISEIDGELQGYLSRFQSYNQDVIRGLQLSWTELQSLIANVSSSSTSFSSSPIRYEQSKGIATGQAAVDNENKLKTSPEYVKSEIERTLSVIAGMKAQGQDTTVQENYLKRIKSMQSFDTGGYTGNFSGGKLGILHEKELVLNKKDTSNVLSIINIADKIMSNIKKFDTSSLSKSNSKSGYTNIQITIENMNGTKKDANNVLNYIGKELSRRGYKK